MNYLTNYYKNRCETLQEQLNHLQNLLNEVKITKVVNGKTVSWDPDVESEEDAEIRAGAYTAVEPIRGESKEDRSFRQGEANFQADAERAEEEKLKRDRSRQISTISPSMQYNSSRERYFVTGSREPVENELSTAEERAKLQVFRNRRGSAPQHEIVNPKILTPEEKAKLAPSSGRKQ